MSAETSDTEYPRTKRPVPRRKGRARAAPATLPSWPSLTAKRLGTGGANPAGGENSGGSSEVEVEAEAESGCAATLRVADAVLRVPVAVVVGAVRERRRGGKRSAAVAMDPPRAARCERSGRRRLPLARREWTGRGVECS